MIGIDLTQNSGSGLDQPVFRDLADHFLNCAKLGRYLTVTSGSRFIITDDFRDKNFIPQAAAMAAIYSKDGLVAEAALLPLSQTIPIMDNLERDKFERLFNLIEQQALLPEVKHAAGSLIGARFRADEIRALENDLGNKISPARARYRDFLLVVKRSIDRDLSEKEFLDEFKMFTQDVAGRLDFGIYSFCIDNLFKSQFILTSIKKLIALEIIEYPSLVRRELLSNILASDSPTKDVVDFTMSTIERYLPLESVIEIKLLKDLKLHRFSMEEVSDLVGNPKL